MRFWGAVAFGLCATGCEIDVLGDWGSDTDPWCEPASCGGDHARLFIAVPMTDAQVQRTDLWLSICHAGQCDSDVHLEWSCRSRDQLCDLECAASADVLGGKVAVRRGGTCGSGAIQGVCVELDLATSELSPGDSEIVLVLDDAHSGRRVIDQSFVVELAEKRVESCSAVKTCLQGERREVLAAFDPATAAAGEHQLELAAPSLSVSAAERHTCGTRADGRLSCWGNLPSPAGSEIVPAGFFQSVGVGYFQDCALGLDGIVTCFGNDSLAGRALEPPPGVFRQIAVGPTFGCGVRPSGRVECWGDHACELPRAIATLQTEQIVASSSGTTLCALGSDGSAQCTGDWDLVLTDAVQIAAGSGHLCRLAADGAAHCRYGDGPEVPSHSGPFVDLVAGAEHACGLAADGTVTCFGTNAALVAATPTTAFAQLSSSEEHVCGIGSAGGVFCWGSDDQGQSTPPPDFP